MVSTIKNTLAAAAIVSLLALGFASTASAACATYGLPGATGIQMAVNQMGRTPALVVDGKIGPMSKAGVMWAQGVLGVGADGAWGPITNAAYVAWVANGCDEDNNDDNNNNNGSLEGDFGTISDVNELSQYNNEEVGEGDEDVIVLGFEVEADNDGDIMINSARVSFDSTGNTGSDNLDDYIDSVSVWMGDEMVGEADADDFSESSGVYTKTIALDDSIVRADDSEKFYVAVNAVNNLDSGDITSDSWTVDVENLRFEDGSGVVTTESGYDLDGMDVAMDFVTFSQSADTELHVSSDSDSPDAGIVMVDNDEDTDDVLLLKGTLELEGDSDVTIEDFPVTLQTSGGTNVDGLANSLTLVLGNDEYTESVTGSLGTSASITFDNIDFDIEAGDEIEFEVRADINDIEDGSFDAGDMLKASITSTNMSQMDVENEEGDQLSDSTEKSGTALGDYQEFRVSGIMVDLVSTSTAASTGSSSNDDAGTFNIKFKVTAVGDDIYLATVVANSVTYTVDQSGTATTGGVSAVIVNNTDTDLTSTYNWLIEEDESETLTLTVVKNPTPSPSAGLYRASLTGIKWDTDDDQTPDNTYTSELGEFRTDYLNLN